MITSTQNTQIKRIGGLKRRRIRDELGVFRMEGHREIDRALDVGVVFDEVVYCPSMSRFSLSEPTLQRIQRESEASLLETDERVFEKLTLWQNPEGLLVVAQQPSKKLVSLPSKDDFVCLVVEGVEKPGNLGGMFRTADAVGCNAVLMVDSKVDLFNPNVIRASLGTVFTVPSAACSFEIALDWLRARGIRIISTSPQADQSYVNVVLSSQCAIVIGSEKDGLTDRWFDIADECVKLPTEGYADSLNAAMAANALLFESYRQRVQKR